MTAAPVHAAAVAPGATVAPPPEVSVVILTYNSAPFIVGCLDNLARTEGVRIEVICVDNASRDDSFELMEKHPLVTRAIQTGANLGFSGGNNVGWREARAPIVVFLNPDCNVLPGTIARLIEPLREDPTVAITGAKLLYPYSRRIQHAGGLLHPHGMGEHPGINEEDGPKWSEPRDADYVTGALMAIRLEDVRGLGGFDEEYHPAYYEETDWCVRVRRAGRRVRYVPEAVAWHWESPGLTRMSETFIRTCYRNRMRFLVKNHTMGELLKVVLPAEAKWFVSDWAQGFRRPVLRSYVGGVLFALKCMARGSRRRRAR